MPITTVLVEGLMGPFPDQGEAFNPYYKGFGSLRYHLADQSSPLSCNQFRNALTTHLPDKPSTFYLFRYVLRH
ncbi:hypothetical protein VTO73DRAFT_8470 [Trametes versicolor]